jgi:hypothetical protein
VHPAAHVVLLEGEARLVEWEDRDVGIVKFELSEDGSELRVLFAAGFHVAHHDLGNWDFTGRNESSGNQRESASCIMGNLRFGTIIF